MNDWWNDPPDVPEEYEEHAPEPASENYDTLEEYRMDVQPVERQMPAKCPHGNEWGSCDHCDFLGDIAYDAQRERR